MSKIVGVKKVGLGIVTAGIVFMTALGSYTQAYAWGPGGSKEEIEVPLIPETPYFAEEVSIQEEQEEVTQPSVEEVAQREEETEATQPPVEEVAQREEEAEATQALVEAVTQQEAEAREELAAEVIQTSVEEPLQQEKKEEAVQPPVEKTLKQEEATILPPVAEIPVQEEVIDEIFTVEAPQRIYHQDWTINPNDWTYTETPWIDGIATVEGHFGSEAEIQRMYELINEYRVANVREPLTYNIKMNTVSRGANERAVTTANYWEHWAYRFSENIAYTPVFYSDYDDMEMVDMVFRAWIESEGHRNNILNAGSTKHETAISVFYKKVEGGYERYWVQCFR